MLLPRCGPWLLAGAASGLLCRSATAQDYNPSRLSYEESKRILADMIRRIRSQAPDAQGAFSKVEIRRHGPQGSTVCFDMYSVPDDLNNLWRIFHRDLLLKAPDSIDESSVQSIFVFEDEKGLQIAYEFPLEALQKENFGVLSVPVRANRTKICFGTRDGFTREDLEKIAELYGTRLAQVLDNLDNLKNLGVKVYGVGNRDQDPDWSDIGGYESVKQEIKNSIILALEHPQVFDQIAAQSRVKFERNRPKGILFAGPPGTGKTTIARIIAARVNIPLVYVPLESIVSKWYGESEKNLSQIFDEVQKLGDVVLFFDEIDALGYSRDQDLHEVSRRILSVLLQRIEGFESSSSRTIVIGATNRPDDLDAALRSRFDVTISFPTPAETERVAIFKLYAKHLDESAVLELARESDGLSGRDIKDLCGYAERMWAAELLKSSTTPKISAPPKETYLQAIRVRFQYPALLK
jgi:SpoVK/Ycf46/Vps4 family AAA+-type ATPase